MSKKKHVTLNVNGKTEEFLAEPRELLIYTLRERLNITGPHIGCETSHCGACTVTINGKSVKSCTMFAVQAEGAEITTIEGIGGPDNLHPLQEAFKEHHGLQCGYCTPGMITRATKLLEEIPNPTEDGNPLWHGWQSLPVHRLPEHCEIHSGGCGPDECSQGGRRMKDEITREERVDNLKGMGCSRKRVEDARFTQGKGNYVDDIKLDGMLFGDFVRSPYAHARVKSINKDTALKVPGVLAVLTADDLRPLGLHWMPTLAGDKQMVLADGKVLFQGQEVAFVVAEDRYAAADGIEAVESRV